ncbi:hypothetical protein K402DRAFT_390531 [Aulographum hederae CBS 113979]|uniref:DUF6604 domain-containing protein n=1 Tax=Aulographum hederae CBS 113979 TaxID=1176131 RepID=A0A6G1H8N7_9PEZI|nr:hypothetical protein K402DRAFT_390531 [Aulographum hederae CBS 113979]
MLPNFLVNTYSQYKADTDAIATWLANTATRCGYSPDLLSGPTSTQTGRSKGKAKKATKEQAQNSKAVPKYTLAIKDFISLAHYIAGYTHPPVTVTSGLVAVLDRAISVRKTHGDTMKAVQGSKRSAQLLKSDQKHSYFVGILEEVRDALKPRMPVGVSADTSSDPSGDSFRNMFAGLSVDEPDENILAGPTPASMGLEDHAPRYRAELVNDGVEENLAIYCLFMDLARIRQFIKETWTHYKVGWFDIVSASISTNTAIDLARGISADFLKEFPRHSNPTAAMSLFIDAEAIATGADPNHRERRGDPINYKLYTVADMVYLPTYILLESFSDVLQDGELPSIKPGYFGKYDPLRDRSKLSSRDKFNEDKILLLEVLPDFCFLIEVTKGSHIPGEDEFTRLLRDFYKTKTVSLPLAFAAQVFLDIQHILRDEVARGYVELCMDAKNIETTINQNLGFHENLRIENWPKQNDQVMRDITRRIQTWVRSDAVAAAKRQLGDPSCAPTFKLLKEHPWLCGLISYSLKSAIHEVGVAFANAWGSILVCAQLYTAVRRQFLQFLPQDKRWADMDLAILMHGSDTFLLGKESSTIEDCMKRFALSMGASASNFAANKRKKANIDISKTGPRGLHELAPVSQLQLFKDRFLHPDTRPPRVDLTTEDVKQILEKAQDDDDDGELDLPEGYVELRHDTFASEERPETMPTADMRKYQGVQKKKLQKRWEKYQQCTPVQLLQSLRLAVQVELPELTFDHLRLHRMCWMLLRNIKNKCHDKIIEMFGPGYLEEEYQLPYVVGYLFMAATTTTKIAKELGMVKKNDIVTSKLLMMGADCIREMIDTGLGGIGVRMLSEFGRIPIQIQEA